MKEHTIQLVDTFDGIECTVIKCLIGTLNGYTSREWYVVVNTERGYLALKLSDLLITIPLELIVNHTIFTLKNYEGVLMFKIKSLSFEVKAVFELTEVEVATFLIREGM